MQGENFKKKNQNTAQEPKQVPDIDALILELQGVLAIEKTNNNVTEININDISTDQLNNEA